jgi:hypothetical protein
MFAGMEISLPKRKKNRDKERRAVWASRHLKS